MHYIIAYDAFWTKTEHFQPKKGPFWVIGARKRPAERPNGHLPENRRHPELPEDMGKILSHWVGSVWGQKSGLYGLSVEKNWFLGQKYSVFWPQSHIIGTYSKFFVTIMTGHHMGKVFVLKSSHGGRRGGRWGPKIPFLAPKRAILGNRGQKTARRAAQRAPTRKPKVSRVTWGHGEDMISLSRGCQRPKKWVMWA